ncbi:hypothetical protein PX554_17930 [Sphingomonas sp. H39-1-10]|uniref:hypothetical protein n=1 Tax=Sphingomonas pollutisoli TaxID=3030829 RepID=UPI0023BA304A|nr:hypothetical protein [Sphingomonas pollutisoli]MDF0490018.1 hypothetical protein [Sphingomonas pollutisoli]
MARRTTKPAAPPATASAGKGETITIRMYRQILGDCFLLTHDYDGRRFRALVDCGALQCIGASKPNTKAAVAHIGAVVDDLLADTGGELDLVIGTHEHYDHLSGFLLHFDVWQKFTIKQVWLAWTEDYTDSVANDIRDKKSKGLAALAALVGLGAEGKPNPFALDRTNAEIDDTVTRISDLLQFYGEIDPWQAPDGQALAGAGRAPRVSKVPPRSCLDVFDWLKSKAADGNVTYLSPGQQKVFGVDNRLKASVFGPPRTRDRLLKLDPTDGPTRETYLVRPDDVNALDVTLKLRAAQADTAMTDDPGHYPFAERFRRWEDETSTDAVAALYYKGQAKRRIDGTWLGSAETLALKIDGDVNNTSLALAIEVPGRDVLLFPADAQVGNWLSWHDQQYPATPVPPGGAQESAEQILARVIFYKVGHHGSHNATARLKGLEMMTSPDLVAMMPVVEAIAREQVTKTNPDGWAMPYGDLYARLKDKTAKRIVRGDGDRAEEEAAFATPGGRFALTYSDNGPNPLWAELTTICRPA